ncbi:MAG: hypothetical protein WKG07_48445 [Hymenobacter sp.]
MTNWRTAHPWALALLPAGRLVVGLACHYSGDRIVSVGPTPTTIAAPAAG